jgi:hypothetical protein
MSLQGLLERRALVQGVLLLLGIAFILCSIFRLFEISILPYRILLFVSGTTIVLLDIYLIMTEDRLLIKHITILEKIPKKRKVLQSADIFSTGLHASLYAVIIVCLFTIGVFYPSFAWASWVFLPPITGFLCGYLVNNFKKTVVIILAGYILSMTIALMLYIAPFFEAYQSSFANIARLLGLVTSEGTLACVMLTTISFHVVQVPISFFAAWIGASIKNW